MDDKERGLYDKYIVRRSVDPSGKHADCSYFVLDLTHDPHAWPALLAYARSCATEYPALSRDLRRIILASDEGRKLVSEQIVTRMANKKDESNG